VQGAVRVVDEIALAQRIERVLPAGMQLACKGQRIGDLGDVLRELAEPGAAEVTSVPKMIEAVKTGWPDFLRLPVLFCGLPVSCAQPCLNRLRPSAW